MGASYRTSSIQFRERVLETFVKASEPSFDDGPSHILEKCLVVTCNRIELYVATDDPERAATSVLAMMPVADRKRDSLFTAVGTEAVAHLFRVAVGLDSLVVGEDQILQQVRDAAAKAGEAGTTGPILSSLFASASHVGRRLRQSLQDGQSNTSVSALALEFAIKKLGSRPKKIMLIGTGKTAKLAASRLSGAEILLVSSRNDAAEFFPGAAVISPEQLGGLNWEGDLVISATNHPGYVLKKGDLPSGRRLVLMDLAFPRNIDPAFKRSRSIRLYDLDDLATYARSVPSGKDLAAIESEVQKEAERFTQRLVASRLSPILSEIYRWAEDIRKKETEEVLRVLPDLPEDDRRVIEAMSRSLVGKLLAPEAAFAKQDGRGIAQAEKLRLLESVFHPEAD